MTAPQKDPPDPALEKLEGEARTFGEAIAGQLEKRFGAKLEELTQGLAEVRGRLEVIDRQVSEDRELGESARRATAERLEELRDDLERVTGTGGPPRRGDGVTYYTHGAETAEGHGPSCHAVLASDPDENGAADLFIFLQGQSVQWRPAAPFTATDECGAWGV